jgi:hypothetical protein
MGEHSVGGPIVGGTFNDFWDIMVNKRIRKISVLLILQLHLGKNLTNLVEILNIEPSEKFKVKFLN